MEPNNLFFASDLHLSHKAMTQKGWRTPGYEERWFTAAHNILSKNSTLFLLGDIAFAKQAYWFNRLSELPGEKVLVCGNHDRNRENWYKKWGFRKVVPFGDLMYLKLELGKNETINTPVTYYGNILLSHVPAFESVGTAYDQRFQGLMRKGERWFNRSSCILNIHGHTHGKGADDHRTMDVGIDVIGEQVISLAQILAMKFPGINLGKVEE